MYVCIYEVIFGNVSFEDKTRLACSLHLHLINYLTFTKHLSLLVSLNTSRTKYPRVENSKKICSESYFDFEGHFLLF